MCELDSLHVVKLLLGTFNPSYPNIRYLIVPFFKELDVNVLVKLDKLTFRLVFLLNFSVYLLYELFLDSFISFLLPELLFLVDFFLYNLF